MDDPAKENSPPPLPPAFRNSRSRRVGAVVAVLLPLCYLGFYRLLFVLGGLKDMGGVVSLSFIFGVPLGCGIFSVALGRAVGSEDRSNYVWFGPLTALFVGLLICIATRIEAIICVIMASPILIACALLGGAIADSVLPRHRQDSRLELTFAVLLPLVFAAFEGAWHWPTEYKSIENTVVIQASADTIWPEIASVCAIAPAEIRNRWIYFIGFPKPIAATLDREGQGGVRTATFERGVSFFETVTTWDRPRKLAFTIHADPDFIPHTAFDRHIIVGGRFYDVLDGIYEIEPLSPTICRLHLTSHHRLGTRFNAYAGWWSEKIMDQIQGSILEVIQRRAERRQQSAAIACLQPAQTFADSRSK